MGEEGRRGEHKVGMEGDRGGGGKWGGRVLPRKKGKSGIMIVSINHS